MDLSFAPERLTPQQRKLFWIVAAVCAATRLLAVARTLWEWDEALFCLGMRAYDVSNHQPHPPGFPVYIALAKLVRLVVPSDFRALQTINVVAGMLLFPAVFCLARELRMRVSTSIAAGALCAFFSNVWFFGGTAFSDVASIVVAVCAVVFLLRGVRSRRDYWIGTLLLALAIGIRPQNLLLGLFPGALATFRRRVPEVIVALLIGIVVAGGAFAGAAAATGGLERYRSAVKAHSDYISKVDSFRSPRRPPLWRLFDRFFIKQHGMPLVSLIASLFVIISAVAAARQRDASIGYALLIFAPMCVVAWLILDRFSTTRFSIGYCPLFALMAADGIARVARGRVRVEAALATALVAAFTIVTLPALATVRGEESPTVQAMEAVRRQFDPARDRLFVGFSMTRFVDYFLPDVRYIRVMDDRALPLSVDPARPAYLLTEINSTEPTGSVFRRDRRWLWNIARRHYYVVALEPIRALPRFVAGWYAPDRSGIDEYRWIAAQATAQLPPQFGTSKLRLQFDVPDALLSKHAHVDVILNGRKLDRIELGESTISRDYVVAPAPSGLPNTLVLSSDQTTVGPHGEPRSVHVRFVSWGAG